MSKKTFTVIGGGAAGFFAAINAAFLSPDLEVFIIEKSNKLLAKVKVSGGGRCNVTHACFDPRVLVGNYPRGKKELLGPFSKFQPGDVFSWFEQRGVPLKTEDDGRVFPLSNSSQTIIDCFENEAKKYGVIIKLQTGIEALKPPSEILNKWVIVFADGTELESDYVMLATGSSPSGWKICETLGHQMINPVPSLFTFNINDNRLKNIAGASAQNCCVAIRNFKVESNGPIMITHWGLSGPAILKLSAEAARNLADVGYKFQIEINWDTNFDSHSLISHFENARSAEAKKLVNSRSQINIPLSIWKKMIPEKYALSRWADLSNKAIAELAQLFVSCSFEVEGKSTFKEEFVTAGGISLSEINFKTLESKRWPGLYVAGEVLDIDAVTGGFNFQAAWTTAYIAACSVAEKSNQ